MNVSLPVGVAATIGGVFGLLALSSALVYGLPALRMGPLGAELRARVGSWWVMAAVFAVAIALDRLVATAFLAFVSFLALKEYLSLIPTRRADRRVLFWAYLAIPLQYLWIWLGSYGMFIIWVPVYMFLFLPLRMVVQGETQGFLRAVGTLHWGLMLTVFCLGHMAYLLALPPAGNPAGGGAGLLLFLVLVTQLGDVAGFVWGKLLGRRRVVPRVSPNKTWEGLLGGAATAALVAGLVGPLLTPLGGIEAAAVGLLLALVGFVGDVNVSSLKRDLGVKDSGSSIPGHGGILDRVNSLTYAAPVFFHYLYYVHYGAFRGPPG